MNTWQTVGRSLFIVFAVLSVICFLSGTWTSDDRWISTGFLFVICGLVSAAIGNHKAFK